MDATGFSGEIGQWRDGIVAPQFGRPDKVDAETFCSAITKWPWAWSVRITLLQADPSAQNPWTKTMFALFVVRFDAKMPLPVLLFFMF